MGFFSGRVTFARYKVHGGSPGLFGSEHLDRLADYAVGSQRVLASDGVEVGWTAGGHILDKRFDLAKNIVNETLHFALRIDTTKIPSDLMRAYVAAELEAAASANPSGRVSSRQKREARDAARDRLEQEAKDGRFLKRKAIEVLWDAPSNELLVGTTSMSAIDRLHSHFEQTFGVGFEPLTSGKLAFQLAEVRQQTRGVDDATLAAFVPGITPGEASWIPDEASRDFLGSEYLLWLWYQLDSESDTIALADGSEVALMIARSLALECPRGQTGKETIQSDGPTRLPEARRAIQSGKLPRKVGLIAVRHDHQYELTLSAEALAVTGARLPAAEASEERQRLEERVTLLRGLLETLDLLYDTFGRVRLSEEWPKELARMQKWLAHEEPRRLTA